MVEEVKEKIKSKKPIKINGTLCSYEDLKKTFMSIRKNHIDYILTYLTSNTNKITNLRAYLIVLIYNAPLNVIGVSNKQKQINIKEYYTNDKEIWENFLNDT